MVEVLSGILSQDGCSFEKNKWGNGVFIQAINIKDFLSVKKFKNGMERLIHKLKSSRKRKNFTEILFPGEIEFKTERRRLEKGIMIPTVTWKEIVETADKLGLLPAPHHLDADGSVRVPEKWENMVRRSDAFKEKTAARTPPRTPPRAAQKHA